MCGRYYIESERADAAFSQMLDELQRREGGTEAHAAMKLGEVYPAGVAPALFSEGPTLMKWGYAGYKNRVINARSETVFEKPMFRGSVMERRCLLPASGYYEWRRTRSGGKSKQKYALYLADRPMIYMAGLWRVERGEALPVFVILTKEAPPSISQIHDRMPVILPDGAREEWIAGGADPARLLRMAAGNVAYRPV